MEQVNREELERAAKRIMEMNSRASKAISGNKQEDSKPMSPYVYKEIIPNKKQEDVSDNEKFSKGGSSLFNFINFKKIVADKDRTLLAGIMLLLGGETADEKLLLALLYIML